jgi:hypothetical protein
MKYVKSLRFPSPGDLSSFSLSKSPSTDPILEKALLVEEANSPGCMNEK